MIDVSELFHHFNFKNIDGILAIMLKKGISLMALGMIVSNGSLDENSTISKNKPYILSFSSLTNLPSSLVIFYYF